MNQLFQPGVGGGGREGTKVNFKSIPPLTRIHSDNWYLIMCSTHGDKSRYKPSSGAKSKLFKAKEGAELS